MSDDDWNDDDDNDNKADTWDDDGDNGGNDEWDDDDGGGGGGGTKKGKKQKSDDWADDFDNDDAMNGDGDGDGDGGGDTDSLDIDIRIANMFYEGEDNQRDNLIESALDKFNKVNALATSVPTDALSDDSRTALFQSVLNISRINYKLGHTDDFIQYYTRLLQLIPTVTRNEGSDAIDAVLNTVQSSTDLVLLSRIYELTLNTLRTMSDTERMHFTIQMKLAKLYIDRGDYSLAHTVLHELHQSCQIDGVDDGKNKGSELLEIYALQMRMNLSQHHYTAMRTLYEKTHTLSAAVKDPRSQSVIRECWGWMFASSGQWSRAYTDFYTAFTYYQECGQTTRAKACLRYVVVSNMLSGGQQNPFDAREAKVYQNDSDITAIVGLRHAYERCDVAAFNKCIDEVNQLATKENDTFIQGHLNAIRRDFYAKALLQILHSYSQITIEYLSRQLSTDVMTIENILLQLIHDGQCLGRIDQVNGILMMKQRGGGEGVGQSRKYAAIDKWTTTVERLTSTVSQPQMPLY